MSTAWNFALSVFAVWWVSAFLVGWAGSVAVVHSLKMANRRSRWLLPDTLAIASWVLAMLTAFGFAALYATEAGASPRGLLLVAIFTGLWSPIAFAGLQRFLRASPEIGKRKFFGWVPDLTGVADWLSADESGKGGDDAR